MQGEFYNIVLHRTCGTPLAMALLTINFLLSLITGYVTTPDEVLSGQPHRLIGFLHYQPHGTGT